MTPRLVVFDDAAALAHGAASFLLERALAAPAEFALVLSGGSTPRATYELLGQEPYLSRFPWARMQFFWGDERCVPPDDPASNYGMALHAFLSAVPVPPDHVHPMLTERMSPREAADAYAATLRTHYGGATLDPARPLFDVALLGIGEDGHTASLIPGEKVLDEYKRWVAEVPHGRDEARITLTYPALDASRVTAFLVSGRQKRAILRHILDGATDVPAARLRPSGEIVILADRDAAG